MPVAGQRLQALRATLASVMEMRLWVEHPTASAEDIARMQASAISAWYAQLNASWPAAPFQLDDTTLHQPALRCTVEFYYLADYYARAISATPTFAEQHGHALLRGTYRWWQRALPMRTLYAQIARRLAADSPVGLRMIGGTWHSATIQWQADADIASLPDNDRLDYLRSNAAVYTCLFRAIPYHMAASPRARFTENLSMLDGGASFIWEFSWEGGATLLNAFSLAGFTITVLLIALALHAGSLWMAFVAFLPAILTMVWSYQRRLNRELDLREVELAQRITQAELQATQMARASQERQQANEMLHRQVETLTRIRQATLSMSLLLDEQALLTKIIEIITTLFQFDRVLILVSNPEEKRFGFGAISQPLPDPDNQFRLEHLAIPLQESADFPVLTHWLLGQSTLQESTRVPPDKPIGWLFSLLGRQPLFSVPLLAGAELLGVIIVDNHASGRPFSEDSKRLLEALATNISIALQNARLYQRTDAQLAQHVKELDIMRQVDVELMEALSWERVLNMILDWGLRITGAHSASLAMADPAAQELRMVAGYGLDIGDDDLKKRRITYDQGIMGRVARTGTSLIIDDVRGNPDYVPVAHDTAAYLSVPIRRRGRVIAVMNLASTLPGAFTTSHRDFVERLANRASVALDNARLFEETQREREKLSRIVDKTTDIIIVVGFDRRIVLLNEAAIANFRLNPHERYTGRRFETVFAYTPLEELGKRFLGQPAQNFHLVEDIALEDERHLHADIAANEQIGWLIVMHDITPYKETERLKNELITTVSHDLKTPLSVINGYIELLGMYNKLNTRGEEYMAMIQRSIQSMRQLIDDLLDLAHLDAGLKIRPEALPLESVIHESITGLADLAGEKQLDVAVNLPDNLPLVMGDGRRLRQIMINLVSNAIKYTPPAGHITVNAEPRNNDVVVSVEDNGLGISPEDQAQIFERFYRVRRPETDNIEGTGLGLAIVKKLVEAHGGEIGLKSHLGEGSTFYFTVPAAPPLKRPNPDLPRAG